MTDYKWKRSAIDNLQARAKWIDNYQLACKDRDHLVSICNQKEAELKCLRWQVEKAIRVIEEFLTVAKLPLTANMEKFVEALEEFVTNAKAELKLWEDKT